MEHDVTHPSILKLDTQLISLKTIIPKLVIGEGRGGLVVRSRPQVRDPLSLKICRVWGLLHAKSYVVAKRPPVGVAQKFGDGVPAQVSSSSSDSGSKLRGPSLNSPRVTSKWDVNIT
ncbi:hypothetical protein AVEN_185400-1 [Araneus ventricosus]|uniref:Uncharacterized protein n=1 Tax=Araneus ventricosus TaxID=182803 RepID=A0A4Y2CHK6_ARAVE|nr:hypothetical protein AVEN_185400-1 [Araneus ventricosus]